VSLIFRRHRHRTRSALPPAGVLRRERRALVRFREERLRDLGGLLLEMFRRDRFQEDLVRERCEALLEIDDHLAGLDAVLGLSWTVPEPARCTCGAPLAADARFCAACGRSTGEATRQCEACGNALPADSAFCGRCGVPTDPRAARQAGPGQAGPLQAGKPPEFEEKQREAAAEAAEG
jgi:Double zinc ribbon